jgi:hypothetical protein
MRHEPVTIGTRPGLDWKGVGYLISIVGVLFLGAVAWPKDGEPLWYMPALIIGMATSIIGMACRYKAHLDQQREIRKAEADARATRS